MVSKPAFRCRAIAQGTRTPPCAWACMSPMTGSEPMTPTTVGSGSDRAWIIRAMSYSRSISRSGWKNGTVSVSSTEFVPASPKYASSPPLSTGTPWTPNDTASSSPRLNGFGSCTRRITLPPDAAATSARSSRTRSP